MVSWRHKISLASGRFSNTSRGQLGAAFNHFRASDQKDTLVVHFHGGLVSEAEGLKTAERLLPFYLGAGGYPIFVLWQTWLTETLQNNWQEILKDDLLPILVERVMQFLVGKLDQAPGEKGGEVELPTRFAVKAEIDQKQALGQEPYADRNPEAAALDPALTPIEQAQFEALLAADPKLVAAALKLGSEGAPDLNPTLEAELEEARAAQQPGEKSLLTVATLGAMGLRILGRALVRFTRRTDHGIYTTAIEETARELKGDLFGGIVWKHIKKDAADSFAGPGDTHGGTALFDEIARLGQPGARPRIVLVGHSAGCVYICHLLEQAAAALPADIRFEVVFLAAACTFELLDRALVAAGDRVSGFRSFGMSDVLEQQDKCFPPLYLRSLPYLVAGVLEDSVDTPLVGMNRYHSGQPPFDAAISEIASVRQHLSVFPEPWIWSDSQAGMGRNTLARTHGAFDVESQTLESVKHLIGKGAV